MKKCSKCKEIKNFEEFNKNKSTKDGFQLHCKKCIKDYYKKNKEKINEASKKWRKENEEYLKKYYKEPHVKERAKKYRKKNEEHLKKRHKKYYKENEEHLKKYRKDYYQKNKERQNEYYKERRANNPLLKVKSNMRTRLWMVFKNKSIKKNSKTHEMLGIEWKELKIYIEDKFTEGMTWENYGEWHIDHIYPLSKAKDEEHLKKLCHYTNLQPLWAEDNLSKGNKIL